MEPKELEDLLNKTGAKFKLVTLFQKRMRELQRGMPRLAPAESSNLWDIVSAEIMAGKVDLVMGEEADQMRKELALREAEEAEKEKAHEKEKNRAPKALVEEAKA